VSFDLGQVGVPEDDRGAAREHGKQPVRSLVARPRVVHQADAHALRPDDKLLRKRGAQRGLVGVAANRLHGSVGLQLGEGGGGDDVAGVEDEVCAAELLEERLGQAPAASGQVRVRDDDDLHPAILAPIGAGRRR
jgi:hypothetical protein